VQKGKHPKLDLIFKHGCLATAWIDDAVSSNQAASAAFFTPVALVTQVILFN
jgi:hypothetical protein